MSTPYEQAVEEAAEMIRDIADEVIATRTVLRFALPHLLAPIEALADRLEMLAAEHFQHGNPSRGGAHAGAAREVRAALASIKGRPS